MLPVTTLNLARSRLTGLGFKVAPDAQHPFGTGNCCVFFKDRTYLEPITILDRTAADMAAAEGLPFVKRIKRFTERHGEGFAMVALATKDAEADRVAFEKVKIGAGEVHRFGRKAKLPDGSEREIGVATAFADFDAAPAATFFVCEHLDKDVLFQPDYLDHPNGVVGISAVVAVAESPREFQAFLSAATKKRKVKQTPAGLEASADGLSYFILTPDAFRERYEVKSPNPRRGMLFAAFDLQVLELRRAAGYAGRNAIRHENRVVIPAAPGLGAVVAFRSVSDG